MNNILTLNKIAACGTDKFDKAKYVCGDAVENPIAIMVRSASMHETVLDESTIAIARAGAGTNNIPVEKCAEDGVCVFNTPGANANAVKELVILGLLMASRKVGNALDWCKTLKGEGDEVGKKVEKGKSAFAGPEILGKTLGVVGLGAIGALVANAANALGMTIVGYDPFITEEGKKKLPADTTIYTDLNDLYKVSDYISLHLPLNDSTKNMINKDTFAIMKDGVRIVNFARGGLVESAALIDALETGKAAAYVTDFPSDEVIGVDGVTAIPHLGASTPESEDNCAMMAADELIAYIEKGEIRNSVNLPNMLLDEANGARTCIIHKDDAAVLDAIKAILGDVKTASKKGYAYTVADVEADTAALAAIDGVKRVRVIK